MSDDHITIAYLESQFDERPTLNNALLVWQLHRQSDLDLPESVRIRLDEFLDVEATRIIGELRQQDFAEHDKKHWIKLQRALCTDEILSCVEALKNESEKSYYWFYELSKKFGKIPCFQGKSQNWWRQYYYKIRKPDK